VLPDGLDPVHGLKKEVRGQGVADEVRTEPVESSNGFFERKALGMCVDKYDVTSGVLKDPSDIQKGERREDPVVLLDCLDARLVSNGAIGRIDKRDSDATD
jgi:hypothetical protein